MALDDCRWLYYRFWLVTCISFLFAAPGLTLQIPISLYGWGIPLATTRLPEMLRLLSQQETLPEKQQTPNVQINGTCFIRKVIF